TCLNIYTVTAPQGATVDSTGAIYVSLGQHFTNTTRFDDTRPVAEIDKIPLGGSPTPFITSGITTPTVMDIDTTNNTLLLFDGRSYSQYAPAGAGYDNVRVESQAYNPQQEDLLFSDPVQQVKRFNLSDQSLVAAYGALGGRQPGPYNKANFMHVADIK